MKLTADHANPFLKAKSIHDAILQLKSRSQDGEVCAGRVAKQWSIWNMVSTFPSCGYLYTTYNSAMYTALLVLARPPIYLILTLAPTLLCISFSPHGAVHAGNPYQACI
jgi:hypothetical protein